MIVRFIRRCPMGEVDRQGVFIVASQPSFVARWRFDQHAPLRVSADRYAIVEMQFGRAIIVIEATGNFAILLNFRQGDARADGVDCTCRNEIAVARLNRFPVDPLFQ